MPLSSQQGRRKRRKWRKRGWFFRARKSLWENEGLLTNFREVNGAEFRFVPDFDL